MTSSTAVAQANMGSLTLDVASLQPEVTGPTTVADVCDPPTTTMTTVTPTIPSIPPIPSPIVPEISTPLPQEQGQQQEKTVTASTNHDVAESKPSPNPVQKLGPPSPKPLPSEHAASATALSIADVPPPPSPPPPPSLLPLTTDNADTLMLDAPDPIISEPVTPIQNGRVPNLSRRSSVEPSIIPFASASEASRVRNVISNNLNMMAFAQMSSPHPISIGHLPPPHTPAVVTPAQVTLPTHNSDYFAGAPYLNAAMAVDEGLESFARIEFEDSVFQMTTYSVIIGRDQRAMDQAKRDERRDAEHLRLAEEHARLGLPPPSPQQRPDRYRKFSKSYVSEEGGMLGPESDGDSGGVPQRKRKRSNGSSQQQQQQQHEEQQQQQQLDAEAQGGEPLIMDRQYISHTPGAAAVDLKSLRPSPHHTPFIGIHSPGPNIASRTKAISREHLKIQFNAEKNVFEAIPLHKNGFFCDDKLYKTETVELTSGVRLQIKDVGFTFIINGVERGRTGAEDFEDGHKQARRYSEGGKEMSVEFELGQNQEELVNSSDELSELDGSPPELSDDPDIEMRSESEAEDEDGTRIKGEEEEEEDRPTPEQPPKRRGPGRPPKDGIMSKRERRELHKREQEQERLRQMESSSQIIPGAALAEAGLDMPLKRKVGRPRKHPLPEGADGKPEKRKYKPRKPKGEDEGSEAERRRERKERRLARPKSPPLKLRREDFTEEQLAKPNKNYGILIDEVLREAGPDGLILKQIYNRIAAKYPFYHFCTETKGWESSVRHNLIGNSAFSKDQQSGAWTRVPGIELDAGKKRKGDANATERAASAAAAAALAGGQAYAAAYAAHGFPGFGAGGQLAPGTGQYHAAASGGYHQTGQHMGQVPFGHPQGDAAGQMYATGTPGVAGQPSQHLSNPAMGTDQGATQALGDTGGLAPRLPGMPGAGAAGGTPSVAPGMALPTPNGAAQGLGMTNGAMQGHTPTPGQAPGVPLQAGMPQTNGSGTAHGPGALTATGGPAQHQFYGGHAQASPQAQLAHQQQANGVGGSIQGQATRSNLVTRPAVLHPRMLSCIKKFVREMRRHPELDPRWIFSALNRAVGLKPRLAAAQPKTMTLAEAVERGLLSSLEKVISDYVPPPPSSSTPSSTVPKPSDQSTGKTPLNPDAVTLLLELREAHNKALANPQPNGQTQDQQQQQQPQGDNKEKDKGREKEMGELMMASACVRALGALDESVFEWLREDGVSEEECARWSGMEGKMAGALAAYVSKMGFSLPK